MVSKKLLGGLVLCLFIYLTECRGGRGGGGRSGGGSRGGSSWGKGWGGSSSSSSWSKPSSSWSSGSSGSSWGSSYKPSSSWNTGSSSGSSWGSSSSGSHSYPSSTGLSGSGSHSYPSSTGLSGSGSKYPSSSGTHSYPTNTGLSGSGSKYPSSFGTHSYPTNTGLSGSGSRYPSSSGTHSYPSNTGLSGSGSGTHNYPSRNNYNSGYQSHGYQSHGYQPNYIPTYYTAPQHVYITQYRDSSSRYGDLLTGLTLYNMGRSHSYHDHYYYDDYYHHRYHPSSGTGYQQSNNKPRNEAACTLRIKENGKLEVLKIPCEIVSTFTEEAKKIQGYTLANQTVCTSNTTVTKKTVLPVTTASPSNATSVIGNTTATNNSSSTNATVIASNTTATAVSSNTTEANITQTTTTSPVTNSATEISLADYLANLQKVQEEALARLNAPGASIDDTFTAITSFADAMKQIHGTTTTASPVTSTTVAQPIVTISNKTEGNATIQTVKTVTETETIVNVTTCITSQNYTDPLNVKGARISDTTNMECAIDIVTRDAHFRNSVECKTLMQYAKMPPPVKEEKPLLPPRETLKKWLEKPPWWMSMFIAV